MNNLKISADWIGNGANVTGKGISIQVNSRTFLIAVGVINESS